MLLSTLVIFCLSIANSEIINNNNPCGQLFLTQSPFKKKNIQLNWSFSCEDPPDTILLTSSDLRTDPNAQILHRIFPGSVTQGYHETPHSLNDTVFPGNWTEDHSAPNLDAGCFDYYISSVKNGSIIHSQCLSIHPAWMSKFAELRIGDMMIPGTHNSGAWQGGPPLVRNYVLNQDKSLWQQLVYGVRYFDIRIGRYGSPPDGFFINHAFVKCTKLLPELQSVENFLRKSPKEVVILNFHRFPHPKDFSREYHRELLTLVEGIFKDLIFPFYRVWNRKGPMLREFWGSGKRVIVSYRDEDMIRENRWLWPPIRRNWGNVQKVDDLHEYIKSVAAVPSPGNPMTVLMAELTPNYFSVLKHITRNLKDFAIMVNRELSGWLRENNLSDNLNIIATDFFTGNDVINIAIETNFKKNFR